MGTNVSNVTNIAKTALDLKNAKDSKKLAEKERNIAQAEINQKRAVYEEEKKNLLKAKLATKKASMSANGLNFTDGSSAVLLGSIEKEVDDDIRNNQYFSDLSLQSNDVKYAYKRNKNLLAMRKGSIDLLQDIGGSFGNSDMGK